MSLSAKMGADGRSKGWGTVRFSDTASAQRAIGRWHNRDLEGRILAVFLDRVRSSVGA
jgi:hypothetical protein